MATEAYQIYTTIRYTCTTGTWLGEGWQTGFRLAVGWDSHNPWPFDQERRIPPKWNVKPRAGRSTHGDWEADWGWFGEMAEGTGMITEQDKWAVIDAIAGYLTALKGTFYNAYTLQDVRMYACDAAGKATTSPDIFTNTKDSFRGGSTDAMPTECAIAVSTQSVWRGPSGRGRQFFGSPGKLTLDKTGLIVGSVISNYATSGGQFYDALRSINKGKTSEARFTPMIWSKAGGKNTSPNTAVAIASVRVGDEFDTQRRREQGRPDVYVERPLSVE